MSCHTCNLKSSTPEFKSLDYLRVAKFNERTKPKTLLNYEETFQEGKILGKGGFGEVLLVDALDEMGQPTGEKYALKILLKADNKTMEEETGTIADISMHPKCNEDIVCLYDSFQFKRNGKTVYGILSEYIDGYDLSKALDQKPPIRLNLEQIFCITMWLLRTVGKLHAQNYVHKDIKPGNIMWDINKDFVTLIDFGLACVRPCDDKICPLGAKTGRSTICRAGTAGTEFYMPPELIAAADNKSVLADTDEMMEIYKAYDIYAIGMSLYELVDLHLNDRFESPYLRDEKDKDKILNYDYIPIEGIDKELNTIIYGMINPDPAFRYKLKQSQNELKKYGATKGWECFKD